MTLYVAVLYFCLNGTCGFLQSERYFDNAAQCTQDAAAAMREFAKKHPGQKVDGACIDIKIKGA